MNVTSRYNPAKIYYRKIECPAQGDRKIKGDRKENCVKTNVDLQRFDPTPDDHAITVDDSLKSATKINDAINTYIEMTVKMCYDKTELAKKECQQRLDLYLEKVKTEMRKLADKMPKKEKWTEMERKNFINKAKSLVPFIEYDRTTKVGKVMQSFDPKPDGFIFYDEYYQRIGDMTNFLDYIEKIFRRVFDGMKNDTTIFYEPGSRYNLP